MNERYEINVNLAQMLKGGVIMDVVNAEQAKIAQEAGAVAVMALERVPADIRKEGGVARMSDPALIREIKAAVAKEAEANLKEQMIENIAKGMVAKFYKENCLLEQAYIDDNKVSVAQYLKSIDKDLTVTDFKRFTLRAE